MLDMSELSLILITIYKRSTYVIVDKLANRLSSVHKRYRTIDMFIQYNNVNTTFAQDIFA